MLQFLKQKQQHADYGTRVMETETIQKNEVSLKSRMSRGNLIKNVLTAAMLLCFYAFTNKANAEIINYGRDVCSDGGISGNNYVTATLDTSTGILTINGTGNMADFDVSSTGVPWVSYRSQITTVEIGSRVTNIGNVAFENCNNLQWITIPDGVTIIGTQAFENCTSLSTIAIPSSVQTIENYAFRNCTALKTIYNMATMPQNINNNVFEGVTLSGKYLAVPTNSIRAYQQSASVWSNFNVKAPYFIFDENLTNGIGDIILGLDGYEYFYEYQGNNSDLPKQFTIIDGVNNTVKMIVNYNSDGLPAKIETNGRTILIDGYDGNKFNASVTTQNGESHQYEGFEAAGLNAYTNGNKPDINPLVKTNITLGMAACMLSYYEGDLDIAGCLGTLNDITEAYLGLSIMTPQVAAQLELLGNVLTVINCASIAAGNLPAIPGCIIGATQMIVGLFIDSNEGVIVNGCTNASSWSLRGGTLTITGNDAFSCSPYPWADKKDEIKKLIIRSGVTSIPSGAFAGCTNLTDVTMQKGTQPLSVAFNSYYLGTTNSFADCPITTLRIGRNLTTASAYVSNGSKGLFQNKTTLTSVTIDEGVTSIPAETFSGCTKLTNVIIPESIIEIESKTFYQCAALTNINILNSITAIKSYAFAESALNSITIPESITLIESGAFADCANLTDVILQDGTQPLSVAFNSYYLGTTNSFSDCPIATLRIGRNLTAASAYVSNGSKGLFQNKTTLTSVTIDEGVTSIPAETFSGCTSLTNITIPVSVTEIESKTFYQCAALTNINILNSITAIKSYAFAESALNNVTIPESITLIESGAFADCANLTNVVMQDGTQPLSVAFNSYYLGTTNSFSDCPIATLRIGRNLTAASAYVSNGSKGLFQNKTTLTSVTIDEGVTSISAETFSGCTSLTSVTNHATTPQNINANVFGGVDVSKIPLTVPAGSIALYKAAAVWKDFFSINGQTTAIKTPEADKFTIYPNPAKDEIFIRSEEPIEKVEILDISGRLVRHSIFPKYGMSNAINISRLPQGVYFVKIFAGNQIVAKKIIKE